MVSRKKLKQYIWKDEPDRQEPAPDGPGRTPAKKDTRRWCKGKVGREHVLETVFKPWASSSKKCGFSPWNENYYVCHHQIRCKNCGRIQARFLGKDCPDYPKPDWEPPQDVNPEINSRS